MKRYVKKTKSGYAKPHGDPQRGVSSMNGLRGTVHGGPLQAGSRAGDAHACARLAGLVREILRMPSRWRRETRPGSLSPSLGLTIRPFSLLAATVEVIDSEDIRGRITMSPTETCASLMARQGTAKQFQAPSAMRKSRSSSCRLWRADKICKA